MKLAFMVIPKPTGRSARGRPLQERDGKENKRDRKEEKLKQGKAWGKVAPRAQENRCS